MVNFVFRFIPFKGLEQREQRREIISGLIIVTISNYQNCSLLLCGLISCEYKQFKTKYINFDS